MKLLILNLLILNTCFAITFKIAALAPKGTNWAKTIDGFAKEIEEKSEGKIKFKVYFGGTAGDEPDVLRKIRIGQLHGGVFTGKTLGDIAKNVRVIETPFTFFDKRENASKALKGLAPYFDKELAKNQFESLGYYEVGQVYLVSNKKVTNIEELKGIKVWSWEGDEVINAMIESLELVSVPLALPDVLQSLSTGIINAAYAPPLGIIGLQWQTQIKYLVNFPTAFTIGAFLLSQKSWKKLSAEQKALVKSCADKYIQEANKLAKTDNEQGLQVLQSMGVEFIDFEKKDLAEASKIRSKVVEKLKGEISSEAFSKLEPYRTK
tara:strand:- start:78015 stop:78977 length:963 start_codon:yes stop_codon:yes gene_type:complete